MRELELFEKNRAHTDELVVNNYHRIGLCLYDY